MALSRHDLTILGEFHQISQGIKKPNDVLGDIYLEYYPVIDRLCYDFKEFSKSETIQEHHQKSFIALIDDINRGHRQFVERLSNYEKSLKPLISRLQEICELIPRPVQNHEDFCHMVMIRWSSDPVKNIPTLVGPFESADHASDWGINYEKTYDDNPAWERVYLRKTFRPSYRLLNDMDDYKGFYICSNLIRELESGCDFNMLSYSGPYVSEAMAKSVGRAVGRVRADCKSFFVSDNWWIVYLQDPFTPFPVKTPEEIE